MIEIRSIEAEDTLAIRHEVMWPDQPLDYVKLPDDEKGLHYGLFYEGELITVVSLFLDRESAQFRKLATLQHYQGKGYGSRLLTHVFEQAKAMGVQLLWCNARQHKTDFYKRFGMLETAKTFTKGGIAYVVMSSTFQ